MSSTNNKQVKDDKDEAVTDVLLQLDYYMSAQFAGVAVAMAHGLYADAKLNVRLSPECPPGEEPQAVLAQQAAAPEALVVGTIEQNVLAPYAAAHGPDKVTAVAAMFGASPLCLAALPAGQSNTNRNKSRRKSME